MNFYDMFLISQENAKILQPSSQSTVMILFHIYRPRSEDIILRISVQRLLHA